MGVIIQWKFFCTPWTSLIKSNEKLKNLKWEVGIYDDAVTMENGMVVLQRIKNRATI